MHSNLKIIVKHNTIHRHLYGVSQRLNYFAHTAGKKLVVLETTKQHTIYAIV